MVAVVVAVVTGLLGLIPLLKTERRRQLYYLQEESKLADSTEDAELKEAHRVTALVTAQRYRDLVNLTKVERRQAELRQMVAPIYLSVILAGILWLSPGVFSDDATVKGYLETVGKVLGVIAAAAAVVQAVRVELARREVSREVVLEREVEDQKKLLDETESTLDGAEGWFFRGEDGELTPVDSLVVNLVEKIRREREHHEFTQRGREAVNKLLADGVIANSVVPSQNARNKATRDARKRKSAGDRKDVEG